VQNSGINKIVFSNPLIWEKTMNRSPTRKRPCRVCKRWFIPHPRLKDRQKTCGDRLCQGEWHRRKCEQWNHNNIMVGGLWSVVGFMVGGRATLRDW